MKKLLYISIILLLSACKTDTNDSSAKKEFIRETEQVLEHYSNGLKKLEGEKVNGKRHGIWKAYHENGFLWSEGKFWYGKRKGFSSVYYKNGKTQMEGSYKNDLKVGVWKVWDMKGTLVKTVNMDKLLTKDDSLKLELKQP